MNTFKTFFLVFLAVSLCFPNSVSSISQNSEIPKKPLIISRESWWANPLYNDIDSKYWKEILKNRKKRQQELEETQSIEDKKKQQEKSAVIQDYLYGNFLKQFTSQEIIYYHPKTWVRLAWPFQYTEEVNALIIHHTHGEYSHSLEGIQEIHRYHSLTREWWDIGYNYIVWYNGEIFEGKEGGDYVRWAHSSYNNFWTIGISVMGNYHTKPINNAQYESLESLVKYLAYKYGIDLNKKRYYHMNCAKEKCNTFYLETYLDSVMAGHRDSWHTQCPWDELYKQMVQIREDNLEFTKGFTLKKRGEFDSRETDTEKVFQTSLIHEFRKKLTKYDSEKLSEFQKKLDILIWSETDEEKKKHLQILELAIFLEY